ncbi:hypothetical protein P7K49_024467 [Saguinus oedipus]|uniref:Uncharacterized protein n=1 Tax=Saguinus oedipus TaxID=9490 RepID=A0ABQ9UPL1_SAGOE|nr:hypothetical protein P7K49_024467 [Saguinus oedipus]
MLLTGHGPEFMAGLPHGHAPGNAEPDMEWEMKKPTPDGNSLENRIYGPVHSFPDIVSGSFGNGKPVDRLLQMKLEDAQFEKKLLSNHNSNMNSSVPIESSSFEGIDVLDKWNTVSIHPATRQEK